MCLHQSIYGPPDLFIRYLRKVGRHAKSTSPFTGEPATCSNILGRVWIRPSLLSISTNHIPDAGRKVKSNDNSIGFA
jgi:hypothetical protein